MEDDPDDAPIWRDGTLGLTASGQTWDEASSPASHRVARRYEAAWRETRGRRPEPGDFLPSDPDERRGALLALLRTDLALRREADRRHVPLTCIGRATSGEGVVARFGGRPVTFDNPGFTHG